MSKSEESRHDAGQRWRTVAIVTAVVVLLGLITLNLVLLIRQLDEQRRRSREYAFWTLCQPGAGPVERTECFLSLVANGNTRWQGAMLDRLELSHARLARTSLQNARFTDCVLSKADFESADLEFSVLNTCDLSEAGFQNARLRSTTFFKSDLSDANFRNADLLSTSLEQVKAPNAVFVGAKMADGFLAMAELTEADLTAADLTGADLTAAILKNAELALTNLTDADLTDADLSNTNWWRARGLSVSQLELYRVMFPPDSSATDSRKRDFAIWSEQWKQGGE